MPWPVIVFPKVIKFNDKLPKPIKERVVSHIELLEQYGLGLRTPVSKKIKTDLYELRLVGQDSIRLLYTFYKGKFYILHIFKKKSKKIPEKEIKIALDRRKLLI